MTRSRWILACLGITLTASPVRAETIRVKIDDLAFTPAQVSARVGDTIEWVNEDVLAHTATARDKGWDVVIAPRASGRVTLDAAGEVAYLCRFHPNMTGRISVAPK